MVTQIWVNIDSGNGLLPDGTKPLSEPMLTYQSSKMFSDINLIVISQVLMINQWHEFHDYIFKMTVSPRGRWVTHHDVMGSWTGNILCMRPANERWRKSVTSSLIGWAHAQNDHWWIMQRVGITHLCHSFWFCRRGIPAIIQHKDVGFGQFWAHFVEEILLLEIQETLV